MAGSASRVRTSVLVVLTGGSLAFVSGAEPQDNAIPKPTAQHKVLENDVGVWDGAMVFYSPGQPEQRSKGVETSSMLGGFWVVNHFKGEAFNQPFEGRGATGYDPKKGKYVGTWVDTMSPKIILLEGTYDAATRTMTMYSDEVDPATDKPVKARYVTKSNDDGTRVFTLSMQMPDSKEFVKVMEITYTKRK
jgi:hypothetical protein